jgi:hypothetical protein
VHEPPDFQVLEELREEFEQREAADEADALRVAGARADWQEPEQRTVLKVTEPRKRQSESRHCGACKKTWLH